MGDILFLSHRIPFPPDKGDKIRSWHLLRHLAERHRVHLGAFVDDSRDWAHVGRLRDICASVKLVPLHPLLGKIRSLSGLLTGEALTFRYFASASLASWVRETQRRVPLDMYFAYSSAVAPMLWQGAAPRRPTIVDFCDVDSEKWAQYATLHRGPLRWIYGREGMRLALAERDIALRADAVLLATEQEAELFRRHCPDLTARIHAVCNGVDTDYFAPDAAGENPYVKGAHADGGPVMVFTGAMDYWANVDAAVWFADNVFPALKKRHPEARFYIAGARPVPAVTALAARPGIVVTGALPDLRPHLGHATVAVAPLRVARGIQNKVLEALSMGVPMVASPDAFCGIEAQPGRDLLIADTPGAWVNMLDRLIRDPAQRRQLGQAGRKTMLRSYGWPARLAALDAVIGHMRADAAEAAELEPDILDRRVGGMHR